MVPAYALDHVFVCCSVGGAEAELLNRAGFTEGSPNVHPGQGTTCRRFFFANAYLELLWISDLQEARSETTAPTRLLERWRGRASETSPFGIAVRPVTNEPTTPPPFETWAYAPPYLPQGMRIDMAAGLPLTEPEMLFVRFARRPDRRLGAAREPLSHPLGVSELSSLSITTNFGEPASAAARALTRHGIVEFRTANSQALELGFDALRQGRELDLRPRLPLVLRW
jgi:hypothetical protein